jgi:hypothetical protein
MNMSNSVFRAFLECPARAMAMHKPRILGTTDAPEWSEPTSRAMACGTLFDRIVLGSYTPTDKPEIGPLFQACRSNYDDGGCTVAELTTKKGEWNSYALTTIAAAKRLLADSVAQGLLFGAEKHVRFEIDLTPDWSWRGEIDALNTSNGVRIIDVKHPGKIEDGWIIERGRNVRAPWYDVWGYWFQLAGYQYAIEKTRGVKPADISRGILYGTNSDPSAIGYVAIADCVELWLRVLFGRTFTSGEGMLDKIAAIVRGQVEAPACGQCDYCASMSKVVIPDCETPRPVIADCYGVSESEAGQ